jgi:outer membrane lipoprotein-sorting protein
MRLSCHLALIGLAIAPALRADSLGAVLARMDDASKDFRSFSAKLKRTDFTSVLNESDEMTGTMAMRRVKNGNETLTQFAEPNPHAIYFSGHTVRIYSPRANTVEIYDAGKLAATADRMMLLGFGISAAELRKDYDVKWIADENVGSLRTTHIELTPKSADVRKNYVVKIDLWIPDGQANPIQEKVTKPSKDYYLVTYSDPKLNPSLPDSAYTLRLPPGVKELRP